MSRELSASFINALDADSVEVFFAIELFFDTQTLRFWSGLGELPIPNGAGFDVYTGSGGLIAISGITESADIAATGADITLSAFPSNLLGLALAEPYQGRKCKIYLGVIDRTTSTTEASALTQIFTGQMDQMNIEEGAETSAIQLKVESRLIQLNKPRSLRYTSANQKSRSGVDSSGNVISFSGDKGFDFVEDLQGKKFGWGRSA